MNDKKDTKQKELQFLTAKEVSNLLCIPLSTLYDNTKNGRIRAVKIGKKWKYKKSDIDQYVLSGTDFSREPIRRPDRFIDQRAHPRINSNFKCQYSLNLPPFKEINGEGVIKNISAGGILLINQDNEIDEIDVDDPINLKFLLITDNDQKINIGVKGKIVRKTQNGVGIRFKNLSEEIHTKIMEYAG